MGVEKNQLAAAYGSTGGVMRLRGRGAQFQYLANRICYFPVRAGLEIVYGRAGARQWLARHPEWHWLQFPYDLRRLCCHSGSLNAWFEPHDYEALTLMSGPPDFPEDWLDIRPGEIFVDVGGHVGYYTLLAASRVGPSGRVIAVEPSVENFKALQRNIELNEHRNIELVCAAVGARSELVRLGTHERFGSMNSVSPGNGTAGFFVGAFSLDELVLRLALTRLDWVKLDIEGSEVEAILGARQVLMRQCPKLLVEVHDTLEPMRTVLKQCGYTDVQVSHDPTAPGRGWVLARRHGSPPSTSATRASASR